MKRWACKTTVWVCTGLDDAGRETLHETGFSGGKEVKMCSVAGYLPPNTRESEAFPVDIQCSMLLRPR